MKNWLLTFFSTYLCCIALNAVAQKNDYYWLSGYDSQVGYDSTSGIWFGGSIINFDSLPVSIFYDSINMNFDKTNTSYCDDAGNLIFYTNGISVNNANNQRMTNGNDLNAGWINEVWDPSIQIYGNRLWQGIIALRDPSATNRYYLVHSFEDTLPGSDRFEFYCSKTLDSYIDMSVTGGNLIYKNKPILEGDLGAQLTAVRHGNGRDWWILVQKRNTGCFYRILLSDTGFFVLPDLTCGGQSIGDTDFVTVTFSPDGSKFAQFATTGGLNIFDFDRCSGELSNAIYHPLNTWKDSLWSGTGVAISPNNRFLYVSATKYLLQFDLSAPDVFSSVDTVGIYDGYKRPIQSLFFTAQSGPDGKIYISCGNTELDYHVINNPNEKGDSCNFVQHQAQLPTPSAGVPNFPNYRLGALPGSPCDTISSATQDVRDTKEQILKIYPNPATDYAVIDYGFTDWNKSPPTLQICNELGQTVYQQQLPMYSGYQKIDVSNFSSGIYTTYIMRNNGVVAAQKFVKQ